MECNVAHTPRDLLGRPHQPVPRYRYRRGLLGTRVCSGFFRTPYDGDQLNIPKEGATMTKSISCNCGWHEHGTEEELVEAFVQHAQEGPGSQVSREKAASLIREE